MAEDLSVFTITLILVRVSLLQSNCKIAKKKENEDKQNDSLRMESFSCTVIIFVA